MQLHELQRLYPRKAEKRIGRGGKRGKTSGRGHKGQKARAGNSTRPEMRDIIKKLPKLRGFGINRARTVHSGRTRPVVVNVSRVNERHPAGEVTPTTLVTHGLVSTRGKRVPPIKILGDGEVTNVFQVSGCTVSAQAREKIEAAGGSVDGTPQS